MQGYPVWRVGTEANDPCAVRTEGYHPMTQAKIIETLEADAYAVAKRAHRIWQDYKEDPENMQLYGQLFDAVNHLERITSTLTAQRASPIDVMPC